MLNLIVIAFWLVRFRLWLAELELDKVYQKCVNYQASDTLSRLSTNEKDTAALKRYVQFVAVDTTHPFSETHICVIDPRGDDIIPFKASPSEILIHMLPTKMDFYQDKHSTSNIRQQHSKKVAKIYSSTSIIWIYYHTNPSLRIQHS